MSINDKIKQILLTKGYSPSHFADEIGVQRSSISHILSGRNRPSFDIIQKIIKRFPDLGFDWILEDDVPTPSNVFNRSTGSLSANRRSDNFTAENHLLDQSDRLTSTNSRMSARSEISSSRQDDSLLDSGLLSNAAGDSRKRVERILIFYNDGTFQEYSPS